MLRAILNKSWQQHPTRHQLYGHLPPIMKTIQARRTRHARHCWRSKDGLLSDVFLWTPPPYGQSKAGRPARTYIQQLCDDTGCNPEDLPEAMNDTGTWREGQGYQCWPHNMIIYIYIYIYIYPFAYAENTDGFGVGCPNDVKSTAFRSQLEASRVSSHTEES